MVAIVLAVVSMAVRDCLGTFLTIAEARGRAVLAGACDALGDLASIAVTVVGAGTVITHGLSAHSLLVIAAMTITSFVGTLYWVRVGTHLMPAQPATIATPPAT